MCFLKVICFNCGSKLCQFNCGLKTVLLWDVSSTSRVLPQKLYSLGINQLIKRMMAARFYKNVRIT